MNASEPGLKGSSVCTSGSLGLSKMHFVVLLQMMTVWVRSPLSSIKLSPQDLQI